MDVNFIPQSRWLGARIVQHPHHCPDSGKEVDILQQIGGVADKTPVVAPLIVPLGRVVQRDAVIAAPGPDLPGDS